MAKPYSMDLRERAMARLAASEQRRGCGGSEYCCIERHQMGGPRAKVW